MGGYEERKDESKRLEVETIEDTDKREEKGRESIIHKGLRRKSRAKEECGGQQEKNKTQTKGQKKKANVLPILALVWSNSDHQLATGLREFYCLELAH